MNPQFSDCIVVIPAYNEEATVGKVVAQAKRIVPTVLVVNDCSTDRTAQYAEDAGGIVLKHDVRKGYEHALITGFNYASRNSFRFMITIDADGQHDPQYINAFLSPLVQGEVEMVIGLRPKKARLAEKIFAIYTNFRFGISDPFCGMKAYSVKLYTSAKYATAYSSIGTAVALEAVKNNALFREIPIPIYGRVGKPRFAGTIWANLKMIKVLINTIRYIR